MKLKDTYSLEEKLCQPRQYIKKQRHYFASKGSSRQGYGFSSSHVWMWELDYRESWVPKNWCFWTVVLEKTLESPLNCKEIQPVHPKGNQSWAFIGKTDVEAETPILWPPDGKNWLIWKDPDVGIDWRQEVKGTIEDEMVRWHHRLNGHVKSFSCVQLFVTPWTVAYQASPSMGFSRQEYWSGLPFPSPGDLPDQGIESRSPAL